MDVMKVGDRVELVEERYGHMRRGDQATITHVYADIGIVGLDNGHEMLETRLRRVEPRRATLEEAEAAMACQPGGAGESPRPDEPDMVNSPPHYTQGGIETIDAIRAALTPEEFRGYCKGNMIKYIWRERHKGGNQSLAKSAWYNAQLLEQGS